jgi:uncharacterized repeat protein (TIGR01451 family)
VTYTLALENLGPAVATGVRVTDSLPSGVQFVSATPSQGTCSGGPALVCDLGTLASGAGATVVVVVRLETSAPVVNSASVRGNEPDPNPSNDSSTAVVAPSSAIPTVSAWGLLALALGLLAAARSLLRSAG